MLFENLWLVSFFFPTKTFFLVTNAYKSLKLTKGIII